MMLNPQIRMDDPAGTYQEPTFMDPGLYPMEGTGGDYSAAPTDMPYIKPADIYVSPPAPMDMQMQSDMPNDAVVVQTQAGTDVVLPGEDPAEDAGKKKNMLLLLIGGGLLAYFLFKK